jgi:hypothetical protein
MRRVPHGYFEQAVVERDLVAAGFTAPEFQTLALRSRAENAQVVAVAFCQGTPLCNEIMALGDEALAKATSACVDAIRQSFGTGAVDAKMQAHIVMARH